MSDVVNTLFDFFGLSFSECITFADFLFQFVKMLMSFCLTGWLFSFVKDFTCSLFGGVRKL